MKKQLWSIRSLAAPWVQSLENENVPFYLYLMGFFFIVELRFFLEAFSNRAKYFEVSTERFLWDMVHYALSYAVLASMLIGLFHYVGKSSIALCARTVLISFLIILLSPLIDLWVTQGAGTDIYYLAPGLNINVLLAYLTYTLYGGYHGASIGVRYEVLFALIGCFIYFRVKNRGALASLWFTALSYTIIFLWAASPFFIKWFLDVAGFEINFAYQYNDFMMVYFYLIVLFILISALFLWEDLKQFIEVIRPVFLLQLFYVAMLAFGVIIAYEKAKQITILQLFVQPRILIHLVLCMISVLFSCVFAGTMIKIGDADATEHQGLNDKTIAYFSLIFALLYAAIVNVKAFLIICVMNGSYFLFSVPPVRFRRVPFFSKAIIPFNAMALSLLGFLLVYPTSYFFPSILWGIYFLVYFVGAGTYSLVSYYVSFTQRSPKKPFLQGPS